MSQIAWVAPGYPTSKGEGHVFGQLKYLRNASHSKLHVYLWRINYRLRDVYSIFNAELCRLMMSLLL